MSAWRTELPGLDVAPLAVFSRLTRLARHLELARRSAFGGHGLEEWEFDVLSALRRAGAPYELSPGVLVEQTLVTSGTMTNRIDRLVGRGYVDRFRDAADGRAVRVRLTESGRQAVDAAIAGLVAYERGLLDAMDEPSREDLARHLQTLLDGFEGAGPDPR
ncbi:MarR family winged helix-turn-helix transcriptional regulator [Propionicicella superfundia]|uniref:MarR family winged helix-turn-helix transcriptional regulator n=1 Tax=Propionicicella superfundia TaxID=348582 RepID=UPI000687F816|nr:MarR family transcriptional regulator [Propionicicella superfundia]